MNRMLSALAALAMTAGTFALAAPAHAAPVQDVVSISLEGLDSADPADAVRIDRRIRTAAQDLCGSKRIQPMRLRELRQVRLREKLAEVSGTIENEQPNGLLSVHVSLDTVLLVIDGCKAPGADNPVLERLA